MSMISGKHALPFALVILLLVFLVWEAGRMTGSQNAQLEQTSSQATPQAIEPSTPVSSAPSVFSAATPSPLSSQPTPNGPLELPTLREVRDQISQDPHHTPPALLKFAKDLSAHAEAAKRSPQSAKLFFETLEDCVREGKEQGESVPVAAQTLCLTTAEELSKIYPDELGTRMQTLQQNASPDAKRIRNALKRF